MKMRTKSCGVKRRLPRSTQRAPSSTTFRQFPLVNPDDDDDEYANSSETSTKSDDDSDNVADDANVKEKGRPHVDWMEVGACIACDRGGTLLICCVTDCPVSIHEKCARFQLAFDDLGRFYCPYCSCKRQVAKAKELRKKAMLAKKALSDFIDSETVVGEASAKEKHDGGEGVEFDDGEVQNQDMPREDGDGRKDGGGLVSDCDQHRVMAGDKADATPSAVDGSHNAHQSREEETPGIESLEDLMNKEIRDERNIPENHLEEEEGKETRESPKKTTDLYFPKEKRKRFWTHEEEEMLKEGVKKFESKVKKNLPWMKILEFGRHVFRSTRSPSDLKDKWRKIMAKESKH